MSIPDDKLDASDLERLLIYVASEQFTGNGRVHADFVALGMATELLRFFLGEDWTNGNVFGGMAGAPPGDASSKLFLKANELGFIFQGCERVFRLAENLFNLQAVPGIDYRIDRLTSEDLESAYAELQST